MPTVVDFLEEYLMRPLVGASLRSPFHCHLTYRFRAGQKFSLCRRRMNIFCRRWFRDSLAGAPTRGTTRKENVPILWPRRPIVNLVVCAEN